jgi:hypothetical protein
MICLNPILKSPLLASIVAGCCVMLYFTLMTYSPSLPPAVICSVAAAYFVYFMMGGKILCDEPDAMPTKAYIFPVNPLPEASAPEASAPEASAPEASAPEARATMAVANNHTHPVGIPVSAYKIF